MEKNWIKIKDKKEEVIYKNQKNDKVVTIGYSQNFFYYEVIVHPISKDGRIKKKDLFTKPLFHIQAVPENWKKAIKYAKNYKVKH